MVTHPTTKINLLGYRSEACVWQSGREKSPISPHAPIPPPQIAGYVIGQGPLAPCVELTALLVVVTVDADFGCKSSVPGAGWGFDYVKF